MKLATLSSELGSAFQANDGFLLPIWKGLVSGACSFQDFASKVRARRQLTYLTIDTTGACDLKCAGMCYYNANISLRKGPIEEGLLRQAINDAAAELSMRVLTFAGKEPFLNAPRLFSLARHAGSERSRQFDIGIVTNGRHVSRYRQQLEKLAGSGCLDYIDISIDSADATEHDRLRGIVGTHGLAVDAVLWLNRELPEVRTTVPSVLRRDNAAGVLSLISMLAPNNRYFQIQPIQPPPLSPFPPLAAEDIIRFLEDTISLLSGPLEGAEVEVSVELLGIYLLEVVRHGIFSWSEIQEDQNNAERF